MYLDFRLLLKISHTNRLCACYIKLSFSPMWIMVIQGVEDWKWKKHLIFLQIISSKYMEQINPKEEVICNIYNQRQSETQFHYSTTAAEKFTTNVQNGCFLTTVCRETCLLHSQSFYVF